jgi:hypothetical protein
VFGSIEEERGLWQEAELGLRDLIESEWALLILCRNGEGCRDAVLVCALGGKFVIEWVLAVRCAVFCALHVGSLLG